MCRLCFVPGSYLTGNSQPGTYDDPTRSKGVSMKLHGEFASPFVGRVVLFARLKGLMLVPTLATNYLEGGTRTAAFLAMNPVGRMPVLETDTGAIPESDVICEYLEDACPGKGLPGHAHARAKARLLSRLHDLYLIPHVLALHHFSPHTRFYDPSKHDPVAIEKIKTDIITAFGYIEKLMVADPYAAGAAPSLADCALLPTFSMLRRTLLPEFSIDDPTAGQGKLGRWWKTMAADPLIARFRAEYDQAFDAFLRSIAPTK
jgi:glutathione S-transferase